MQPEIVTKLLTLQSQLFDLSSAQEISDFIVNDTYKLIKYQMAVLFKYNYSGKDKINVSIVAISGTLESSDQNINTHFELWLNKTSREFVSLGYVKKNDKNITMLSSANLSGDLKNNWAENLGMNILASSLYNNNNDEIKLIIFNDQQYSENDLIIFRLIIKSYQQIFKLILAGTKKLYNFGKGVKYKHSSKSLIKIFIIIIILAMFFPITPSVMAPAGIISDKNWLINAPINGIINKIYIEPNSLVKKDQILFEYDAIDINNNLKIKEQELSKLQTDHSQAKVFGFDDKDARAKVFRLQEEIAAKQQEIYYAKQQVNLGIVKAPNNGIILFKNKNELLGKPVKIGDTVMNLADPSSMQIEAWLDINDNINLTNNISAYYYSNKSPFFSVPVRVLYHSFEAYITPQKNIAYRIIASLNNKDDEDLIIGDHGQIKIYAEDRMLLGQYIFQKPLTKIRQWFYRVFA